MLIDHPLCVFLRRHQWNWLSPNIALKGCTRCGKVQLVDPKSLPKGAR